MSLEAQDIRSRLAFDVERLRTAAARVEGVDAQLTELRLALERRASALSYEARSDSRPEIGADGVVHLRFAQAQATATLAQEATLGRVLRDSGRLSLIATMGVSRWIAALRELEVESREMTIKGHVDAGRLAYRMLKVLKRKARLAGGCGQLTSSVVVAEFVRAPLNIAFIDCQIEEGLSRGRRGRNLNSDEEVLAVASRALRVGAELLESMANQAEPAASRLLSTAETIEARVASDLNQASN